MSVSRVLETAPPAMMPGNDGGMLKKGNTKNVGRIPEAIRKKMREGISLSHIKNIAANKECIEDAAWRDVKGENGWTKERVSFMRRPTAAECIAANEFLAKYGIGTRNEVDAEVKGLIGHISIDI